MWGCCRFAYCSAGVQARLARLPDAAGGLGQEYLLGVVAERMAKEGDGAGVEGVDGGGGEGSSQMRPRRKQQVPCRCRAVSMLRYFLHLDGSCDFGGLCVLALLKRKMQEERKYDKEEDINSTFPKIGSR